MFEYDGNARGFRKTSTITVFLHFVFENYYKIITFAKCQTDLYTQYLAQSLL